MNIQLNRNTTARQIMAMSHKTGFALYATRTGGAELRPINNAKQH